MKLANRANFDVPVAFFIFNRPLVTARVFSRIAQMRPSRLMIVADGPRSEVESQLCDAARACVADITWDCDVQWNYSDVNLGCRRRMSSGIDWVFKQCDQAILLEDDCLPDPTFFQYCREMLARYEDEDRVMTIGGANFQFGVRRTPYSYYFSAVHHIWGWATWRRAWRHYDVEMKQWPNVAQTNFPDMLPDYAASFARREMAETYEGKLDTWDYQWTFACLMRRAMCILPAVNLISNIGFGPDATHCKKPNICASQPTEAIEFPLVHPPKVELCSEADLAFFERSMKRKAAA